MLRSIILFLIALLGSSGCRAQDDDSDRLRETIERKVCASRSIDDAVAASKALHLEYFVDKNGRTLNAKQLTNRDQLVSSYVVLEVRFNEDWAVRSCKVQVMHTGP